MFSRRGKTFMDVRVDLPYNDPADARTVRIRIRDVVRYYATDAQNITSGCRSIAGIVGDWRPIDYLAQDCLEYFKQVNRPGLEREGRKYGMTLKGGE